MSAASFFAAPSYGGDREPPRPKAVNPATGKEQSWTRASSFASELKNPFGLIKSQGRNLVIGLAKRPDLCRMILAGVPEDGHTKVDEIIDQALGMLAPEAKANEGTAAHAALSHAWLNPHDPVAEEFVPLVAAFAAALREYGLKPVATEQRVLNLAYDSMGNLDWILEEADGTEVTADVKTGNVERAMLEFSVQLAMYAGAKYVIHADGSVSEIPWKLAQSHGILIHIDLEHGNAVSLYRVDLNIGRFGAGIAEQKRAFSKLKPLTPYVTPLVPRRAEVQGVVSMPDHPALQSTVSGPIEITEPRPASAADAIQADVSNLPEIDLDQNLPGDPDPHDRFQELMDGFDKAGLQGLLKAKGWTDISHNRRWLARALVALDQGREGAAVRKYAAAKDGDDASIAAEVAAQPPLEPQGPSTATILEAIAGANSMGALRALNADIVERRGDQAWTDEMVAAAEVRAQELSAAQQDDVVASIMERIGAANSQHDLKVLWEEVTVAGSLKDRWTDTMTAAGQERLAALAAATPPPPANPFG